jgi:Mg-chelatase subunit ChlD
MARPVRRFTFIESLILLALGGIAVWTMLPRACRSGSRQAATAEPHPAAPPAAHPDDDAAARATISARLDVSSTWRDGLAAIVLVDVSGSMAERVRDQDGGRRRKILIAQRAALDLVRAFEVYAKAHPAEIVSVGVYEFSTRDGQPPARAIVEMGPPDASAAASRLEAMKARGGTPIGEAMIDARRALDATSLARRHLLVITDGENTDGVSPIEVAQAMDRQEESRRAPLYFVAFDVEAEAFAGVKQYGGLLLSAKDGGELRTTLDALLSDKILVEAPRK